MDFQRGDRVIDEEYGEGIVLHYDGDTLNISFDDRVAVDRFSTTFLKDSRSKRYPRPGEVIFVSMTADGWRERIFVKFENNKVLTCPVGYSGELFEIWAFWKLIVPEKDEIEEIVEAIKCEDDSALKELAKIILERWRKDE